jgi:hypothetical protein
MPQRDRYHVIVHDALVADGWSITHDPYTLGAGSTNVYVDLGAERVIAAERGSERIAVEVKSFLGRSSAADIEQALGQYLLYRGLLARQEPERTLFLAVPHEAWEGVWSSVLGRVALDDYRVKVLVFNIEEGTIERWHS